MPGNELIGKEEYQEVKKVFKKSGGVLYAHGFDKRRNNIFRVRSFENQISKTLKSQLSVCVSSGTAALYTALKSLNLKKGDEVITQTHTFVATVEAILEVGAKPVLVNVGKCLNMNPYELENAITKKTKCIIPVHMLGNPAHMDKIKKKKKKYNIPIIEDACQSIGAKFQGKHVGTIGDFGTFSFDYGKNITAGEGGVIFSQNKKYFDFLKSYPDHGHANDKRFPRGNDVAYTTGFNFRMTEIQAAILSVQLKKLNFILSNFRKNKKIYKEPLVDKLKGKLEFRKITDKDETGDSIVFFLPQKKLVSKTLNFFSEKNIPIKIIPDAIKWHFSYHWKHMFKDAIDFKRKQKSWMKSKELLDRTICLPINVLDKKQDLNRNSELIIKYLDNLI